MAPERNGSSSPASRPGPTAASDAERGPRRRRRRRGSRGRGRKRQEKADVVETPVAESHPASDPVETPVAEDLPAPAAIEPTPIPEVRSDPDPTPDPTPSVTADVVQVVREARNIANDAAGDERPELYAQRLPALGAELVHWRPRGEREFRYLLRESFD